MPGFEMSFISSFCYSGCLTRAFVGGGHAVCLISRWPKRKACAKSLEKQRSSMKPKSVRFHHLETEHNGASTVHGASDPCHSITPCLFCNCCMVVGSLRRADTNTTFGHQQVARLALDGWWNNGIQRFSQNLSWPPWPSKPAVHYAVFPIFRTKWLWQAALASGKG